MAEVPVVGMTQFPETQNLQTRQPAVQAPLTCGHTFEANRGVLQIELEQGLLPGKGEPAVGAGHVRSAKQWPPRICPGPNLCSL